MQGFDFPSVPPIVLHELPAVCKHYFNTEMQSSHVPRGLFRLDLEPVLTRCAFGSLQAKSLDTRRQQRLPRIYELDSPLNNFTYCLTLCPEYCFIVPSRYLICYRSPPDIEPEMALTTY
jgi:hypothetical protein